MCRVHRQVAWRRLLMFMLSVNIVLSAVIVAAVVLARIEPARLNADVPSYYLPGQPMTRSRACTWDRDAWETTVSCTERGVSGLRYFVSYSVEQGTILRTAKWIAYDNIRLGDLIVA